MRLIGALFCLGVKTIVFATSNHPVSITWVHADIQSDKVSFSIKTTAEDLLYFHLLKVDSNFNLSREQLQEAAQSHVQILQSSFFILDQNNVKLASSNVTSHFTSLNQEVEFNVMDLLKYPLYYKLEFKLSENTELLSFHQTLDELGIPCVSLLSISKGGNQLVENVELSSYQPFTIGRNAVSLSSPGEANFMLSYITLSDTRISHEMTIPMLLLKSFVQMEAKTTEELLGTISRFMAENSTVDMDGIVLEPELISLVFHNGSTDTPTDQSLINIRVDYPFKSIPKHVSISWDSFNWRVRWFRSLIDSFGEQTEHNFSRFQPKFEVERKVETTDKNP